MTLRSNKIPLLAIPRVDRPREKLKVRGADVLSTKELLALLVGSGMKGENVLGIAANLLKFIGTRNISQISLEEFMKVKGIGQARASLLIAAIELGKRFLLPEEPTPAFYSSTDAYQYCKELENAKKEHFVCLYLNAKNKLILKETVAIGSLFSNLVHPREVFSPAVSASAAFIILIHNHPSGDPEPSKEDITLTARLCNAGLLLGIEILDHIIIGRNSYTSLKDKGLLA